MTSSQPYLRAFGLFFAGALLATLLVPLATRPSRAGQQSLALAPGDSITLTCPSQLSGRARGQQATLSCAATGATATATQAPTSTPSLPTTTAAPPTATPGSQPGAFVETFDGQPASPQPWRPANWDVTVHSRDVGTWAQLEPTHAMHGSDCGAPPVTHMVSSYEDAVFLCRDHLMTAINAQGYGVIYLTPNQQADFASGEAVVRFDLSTLRGSQRDWVDLWITPYQDQLQLPLEEWMPDLSGEPRNAVHIRMDLANGGTGFRAFVIKDHVASEVSGQQWVGYESFLTPDAKRRDTFELRITRTHLKFGMPAYNFYWIDAEIADLGWSRGVVQLGHHSYNPTKGDGCGSVCQPNTWHWDNVSISPAVPFTMLKGDRRVADASNPAAVSFPAPAPANAHLRFAGIGDRIEVSFDGGASWQVAQMQAQELRADDHARSYWMPVPAGTRSALFRGANWWGGGWQARNIAIWAQ